jgi:hypothetical protein
MMSSGLSEEYEEQCSTPIAPFKLYPIRQTRLFSTFNPNYIFKKLKQKLEDRFEDSLITDFKDTHKNKWKITYTVNSEEDEMPETHFKVCVKLY